MNQNISREVLNHLSTVLFIKQCPKIKQMLISKSFLIKWNFLSMLSFPCIFFPVLFVITSSPVSDFHFLSIHISVWVSSSPFKLNT